MMSLFALKVQEFNQKRVFFRFYHQKTSKNHQIQIAIFNKTQKTSLKGIQASTQVIFQCKSLLLPPILSSGDEARKRHLERRFAADSQATDSQNISVLLHLKSALHAKLFLNGEKGGNLMEPSLGYMVGVAGGSMATRSRPHW